ncbi:MAG: roadblock/LC7 domain-containing protein [Candidatus Caldipriscus sp.]|jgi:predicted regulator of Ras-like GTPase activity (Roadblock/LC7/MglB family)
MERAMEGMLNEIQKLVPEVLGVIVASDEGLPMGYSISRSLSIQDPIIIAGLVSAASAMMENVLREFKDNDFQLVFTSGEEYAILVGKVEGFYVAFIADARVKLGPLFMEFRKNKERFAEMLKAYK